jgi:hypothetical protein
MKGKWAMVAEFDQGCGDAYDFIRWLYGEPLHWYTAIEAGWVYLVYGGKRLSFEDFRKVSLDILKHSGITPSDTLWQGVERFDPKRALDCDEREEDK